MVTGKRHLKLSHGISGKTHVARIVHRPAALAVEKFRAAPAAHFEHSVEGLAAAVYDNEPLFRHRAHKMMKLLFNRREVFKNIGVVVLEVI